MTGSVRSGYIGNGNYQSPPPCLSCLLLHPKGLPCEVLSAASGSCLLACQKSLQLLRPCLCSVFPSASSCGRFIPFPLTTPPRKSKITSTPRNRSTLVEGIDFCIRLRPRKKKEGKRQTRLHASLERSIKNSGEKKVANSTKIQILRRKMMERIQEEKIFIRAARAGGADRAKRCRKAHGMTSAAVLKNPSASLASPAVVRNRSQDEDEAPCQRAPFCARVSIFGRR
jgi:hypothetical protein